jgi:hypothetical protein
MKSTRLMMGAAVTGCIIAATVSGVSAEENFNSRASARVQGNHVGTSGQLNRTMHQGANGYTRGRQTNVAAREHRSFAQGKYDVRRRVATEDRYGQERRDRREFGRAATDGAVRGDGWAYGGPGRDAGFAAGGYGYAWEPGYDGYSSPAYGPLYGYAPGYDLYAPVDPYYGYAPGFGTGPYYGYAPGFSIGIGPIGIGFGPAWGW